MEATTEHSIVTRRRALTLLGGVSAAAIVGCSSDNDKTTTASTSIPEETAGPFPGDGSNGPNVLTQDGVVRRDITGSFGSLSGTADGVPTTIELTIVEAATGAPFDGAAVYVWHCDQQGRYSLYSQGATNQNYLRGIQAAGRDGKVAFTTIFPAAYSGRWPHVHYEVYPSLAEAKSVGNKIATSQLALPEDICNTVYATSGYEQSVQNMKSTSLARDMVFSDGAESETPSASGDVKSGIKFTLTVPV